jgi:predicted helicase
MTHPMRSTLRVTTYLHNLSDNLASGIATEHTHRAALAELIESLHDDIHAVNEPTHAECGAPDLNISRDTFSLGYIETKDIGANLNREESSEQLTRYRDALDNLILTDYLEFRWYVKGEHRRTVRLARQDAQGELTQETNGRQDLTELLADFLAHQPQPISTARELAERMARLTHLIRDVIVNAFQSGKASELLTGWRQAFAEVLIPELDQPENLGQFADMFAQTLSYGLFSARVMHQTGDFTRHTAQDDIPRTNPFLRDFFAYITGPQLSDEPYVDLVNDLIQVLALADMHGILADFGRATREDDPMMHFYETFLAAYDPQLRERRGVYFTPMPVVSFIVRSVDELLKTRFDLPRGLADTTRLPDGTHKVLVLDPAVGTATFLYAVIDLIREDFMARGDAGMWSGYVRDHLLERIFGFEIMMAPYAVAHFKLALQLAGHDLDLPEEGQARWAYDFDAEDRIRVYLTNALEVLPEEMEGLYGPMQFVAEEARAADQVKQDKPIMVVLGNPPYSVSSTNKGEYIENLMDTYKEAVRDERNIQPLSDDYIKFIRFAHDRIERTGSGIIGMITNHSYLFGLVHRGMREELLKTFDQIYVLNLHGNALMGETTPDGSADKNVFDIRQGVAIALFIKSTTSINKESGLGEIAEIYYFDIWGPREHKYDLLNESDLTTPSWRQLDPVSPYYFFVPKDLSLTNEYEKGSGLNQLFPINSAGLYTSRDSLTIHYSCNDIWNTVQNFIKLPPERARVEFQLPKDSQNWKVDLAQEDLINSGPNRKSVVPISYRVFDVRYTYYTGHSGGFHCRPRGNVMSHMVAGDNLGLIANRQIIDDKVQHMWISRHIMDLHILQTAHASAYLFPLYLYPDDEVGTLFDSTATSPWEPDPDHGNRVPNLDPGFVVEMEEKLGLSFDPHLSGRAHPIESAFGPEDVLAYIYAVFHSPTYRERYAEFLKIDFPRVPLTDDPDLFRALVAKGRQLLSLHLMESPRLNERLTHYPIPGDDTVAPRGGYPKYAPPEGNAGGKVFINREQYFEGVPPEVWDFEIGGYQVLHKWLKDRRGRHLSYDEREHYQRVVVALVETIRLMDEIDAAIPAWPL